MSPFLTSREACELIRRPSLGAFDAFVRRHHIPCIQCGRVKLYDRNVVLAAFSSSIDGRPAKMPKLATPRVPAGATVSSGDAA